jgi:hypothetical protein
MQVVRGLNNMTQHFGGPGSTSTSDLSSFKFAGNPFVQSLEYLRMKGPAKYLLNPDIYLIIE